MEVKSGYKQTEIGVIPEEWEVKRLGALSEFITSGSRGWAAFYSEHGALFVRSKNVRDGRLDFEDTQYVTPPNGAEGNRTRVKRNDVLITITGNSVGNVALVEDELGEAYISQHVGLARLSEPMLGHYVCRFLSPGSPGNSQIWASQSGQSKPGLTLRNLQDFWVALPRTDDEQRAIADALSDVDALLAALDRLIAKKRDLKQAAMQQLLTGQIRLPGFHTRWVTQTFRGLCKSVFPKSTLSSANGSKFGGYPLFVSGGEAKRIDTALFQSTQALIFSDGGVFDVKYFSGDFSVTDHCYVVALRGNMRFYYFWLSIHRSALDTATFKGSGLRNLDKTALSQVEMPNPHEDEQTAIAKVLADMDSDLTAIEQRREKTRALKQGMMQELLTGRTRLVSPVRSVVPLPQAEDTATRKSAHNWQINEAVIIGVLALQFGTEEWPLPRKRRVKLTYLLHRRVEGKAEGYVKKAAGPYNPRTRYEGPEAIALKNGYVREHNNGTYVGFVAGEKIAKAEQYFIEWYPGAKEWLEQFRFEKTDQLELLATVDMAMEDLRSSGRAVALKAVKEVISTHPEWEAKLSRTIFSDSNIKRAIGVCQNLFAS